MQTVHAACERSGRPSLSQVGIAFRDVDGVLDIELPEALAVPRELRSADDAPSGRELRATASRPGQLWSRAPSA